MKTFSHWFFLLLFLGCHQSTDNSVKGLPVCNNYLGSCASGGPGQYCTFGYKWGSSNPFSPSGVEIPGPSIKATEISFKFQDEGFIFKTHSEDNVKSLSFDDFTKDQIRLALAEWQSAANASFVEKTRGDKSDISIILANINQGGLGYPAFTNEPCHQIAGSLVMNPKNKTYSSALHEIGHVLGLGHVLSDNVMNPDKFYTYDHLQSGDLAGIRTIYGSK